MKFFKILLIAFSFSWLFLIHESFVWASFFEPNAVPVEVKKAGYKDVLSVGGKPLSKLISGRMPTVPFFHSYLFNGDPDINIFGQVPGMNLPLEAEELLATMNADEISYVISIQYNTLRLEPGPLQFKPHYFFAPNAPHRSEQYIRIIAPIRWAHFDWVPGRYENQTAFSESEFSVHNTKGTESRLTLSPNAMPLNELPKNDSSSFITIAYNTTAITTTGQEPDNRTQCVITFHWLMDNPEQDAWMRTKYRGAQTLQDVIQLLNADATLSNSPHFEHFKRVLLGNKDQPSMIAEENSNQPDDIPIQILELDHLGPITPATGKAVDGSYWLAYKDKTKKGKILVIDVQGEMVEAIRPRINEEQLRSSVQSQSTGVFYGAGPQKDHLRKANFVNGKILAVVPSGISNRTYEFETLLENPDGKIVMISNLEIFLLARNEEPITLYEIPKGAAIDAHPPLKMARDLYVTLENLKGTHSFIVIDTETEEVYKQEGTQGLTSLENVAFDSSEGKFIFLDIPIINEVALLS